MYHYGDYRPIVVAHCGGHHRSHVRLRIGTEFGIVVDVMMVMFIYESEYDLSVHPSLVHQRISRVQQKTKYKPSI